MDEMITKKQAIEAVQNRHYMLTKEKVLLINDLEKIPSAQPYTINPDGRLWITVDDIDKVRAVVVDEHKSKFCKQFYEDYEDAQPEIIRCKDCKLNPKYEWFGCPMSHLSEKQRPETAWCWKAERRTDERSD